jgi:nicotinamidase-related amidase
MALVVYDMQVGVVDQVACGPAIAARIAAILEVARARRFPIIFTRHMSMPLPLMGRFQRRQAMVWEKVKDPDAVRPWFLRGSPGFAIHADLAPRTDEAIIDKIAFSAFADTPLATILRDCDIVSFAIMGIATEIGIAPTVSHGADLGLVPIVVKDACGAGDAEAAERSHASIAFMGDAIVADSAALIAAMKEHTA